jgi:pilus assembly protein Flp/PilA
MNRWIRGQGLVEYALLLIFVAVVLVALLTILGPGIRDVYQNIIDNL